MLRNKTRCILLALLAYMQAVPVLFSQEFMPAVEDAESSHQVATEAVNTHGAARLSFRDESFVSSERISIGNVATCSGRDSECAELVHVDLGASSPPGEKRIINRTDINSILASEFPDKGVEVVSSDKITVRTSFQEIDKYQIEGYLRDYLEAKLRSQKDLRLRSAQVLFSKRLRMLPGEFHVDIPVFNQLNFDDLTAVAEQLAGRRVLEVLCVRNQDVANPVTLKASVHIEFDRQIPVVRTTKNQGDVIQHQDLELRWVPLNRINANALSSVSAVVERRVKTAIRSGMHIPEKSIERPALVQRGQVVRLMLSKNGLQISGEAKALATGGLGDVVKVFYPATKKSILARVLAENLVEAQL